jgi:hypothetical protein
MMPCTYRCLDGWLPVTEGYVDDQVQKLRSVAAMTPEERAEREAAHRNSVTPCPMCRPEQYELWRGGHFELNHTCPECVARRKPSRAKAGASK